MTGHGPPWDRDTSLQEVGTARTHTCLVFVFTARCPPCPVPDILREDSILCHFPLLLHSPSQGCAMKRAAAIPSPFSQVPLAPLPPAILDLPGTVPMPPSLLTALSASVSTLVWPTCSLSLLQEALPYMRFGALHFVIDILPPARG